MDIEMINFVTEIAMWGAFFIGTFLFIRATIEVFTEVRKEKKLEEQKERELIEWVEYYKKLKNMDSLQKKRYFSIVLVGNASGKVNS